MEPFLPDKSLALFRKTKKVTRDDIVLVDHPDHGFVVRKVSAVGMRGTIGLRGLNRSAKTMRRLGNIDRSAVVGKYAFAMRWVRFLPRFSTPHHLLIDDEIAEDGNPDAPAPKD